ncbi:MAG: hypothetical protein FD153_244 [Rhodospirillaceae bacterium]|nr:MAG: hypothetical protein FD153_244 [Rhodospirillaceae bacterium]
MQQQRGGAGQARSRDRLRDTALVLVGHGSTRNLNSSAPTRRLAEALRRRGLFAEVTACFWKEDPPLREVLAGVKAAEVFVVPNFAGVGYFTHEVIPREMGLSGPLTEVAGVQGDMRRIYYTPPIGAHPRLALLVRRRVEAVARYHNLDKTDLCLLLVGHGSRRPGGSSETAEALAADLERQGGFKSIRTAYLEQEPRVVAWPSFVPERQILVMPLLIAEGLHGSEDLPPLFGLSTTDLAVINRVPAIGPALLHGRRLWYCRGIGTDPDIIDIVLDQVARISGTPQGMWMGGAFCKP